MEEAFDGDLPVYPRRPSTETTLRRRHGGQWRGASSMSTEQRFTYSPERQRACSPELSRHFPSRHEASPNIWTRTLDSTGRDTTATADRTTITLLGREETQWRPPSPLAQPAAPQATVTSDAINLEVIQALNTLAEKMATINNPGSHTPEHIAFGGRDNEDPVTYLVDLRSWLDRHNVLPGRDHGYILKTLVGDALTWYQDIGYPTMEWQLFSNRLRDRFDSVAVRTGLLKKLYGLAQKSGEPSYGFIIAKWGLFKRLAATTPEDERLATIQELLHPRIRVYTRGLSFRNLQHLIEVTTQVEQDVAEATPRQASTPAPVRQARGPDPMAQRPPAAAQMPPSPCRHCGGPHFNRECPRQPRYQPPMQQNNQDRSRQENFQRAETHPDVRPSTSRSQ